MGARGRSTGLMPGGRGVLYIVTTYPMMHVMNLPPWTDRRLWKHYLLAISFAGGKNHLGRQKRLTIIKPEADKNVAPSRK